MTEHAHDLDSAGRSRRSYLLAAVVGSFLVTVFASLFIPRDARYWAHALFWGFAAIAYVPFARRRPLPPDSRVLDGGIVGCGILLAVMDVLRATLPEAAAFRWTMGLSVTAALGMLLLVRRKRARMQPPA